MKILKSLSLFKFFNVINCFLELEFWNNLTKYEFISFILFSKMNGFQGVIGARMVQHLRAVELPCEMVTVPVISELANRCPTLRHLTLDFSNAMQLHDYNDLNAFPCNLYYLCICLSDVIFMEGLMRRIYSFLSSLEVLHLIGTH